MSCSQYIENDRDVGLRTSCSMDATAVASSTVGNFCARVVTFARAHTHARALIHAVRTLLVQNCPIL